MQNKFFGSKLNSVLLLILIVLMVFALRIMLKEKETYLPSFHNKEQIIGNLKSPLEMCILESETYYFHLGMAYDGTNIIYNKKGDLVAQCGGGGFPDPSKPTVKKTLPEICSKIYSLRQGKECVVIK